MQLKGPPPRSARAHAPVRCNPCACQVLLTQAKLCSPGARSSSSSSSSSKVSAGSSKQQLDPTSLYLHALAYFHLWLARGQAGLLQPHTCIPAHLDACVQMLHSAACRAAQLTAAGFDMSSFEATCAGIRRQLDAAAAARALGIAQQLELPCCEADSSCSVGGSSGSMLEKEQGRYRLPRGTIPSALQPDAGEGGLIAARQRAQASLGSLPLLPEDSPPSAILVWLQDPLLATAQSEVLLQLRLHSVERELFRRCGSVDSRGRCSGL